MWLWTCANYHGCDDTIYHVLFSRLFPLSNCFLFSSVSIGKARMQGVSYRLSLFSFTFFKPSPTLYYTALRLTLMLSVNIFILQTDSALTPVLPAVYGCSVVQLKGWNISNSLSFLLSLSKQAGID
jgi:hypothetical protein